MFNSMIKKMGTAVTGFITAAAIMAVSVPAKAATGSDQGTVSALEIGSSWLYVNLPSGQYQVFSGQSCVPQSQDVIKAFLSAAQSALLAGKKINVLWQTCPNDTTKYIYAIDLIQ